MPLKISVVMPVFNEAGSIISILDKIKKVPFQKEIIIVNDGSTDNIESIIDERKKSDDSIKFISYKQNKGKGYALRKGFENAVGDIVIIQDADLEYYPEEYNLLVTKLIEDRAEVVYGTRFDRKQSIFAYKSRFYHFLGNKIVTLLANLIYKAKLTDIMTCYKAFRIEVIKKINLECNGFGIEAEITAEVLKGKYRIIEVPISYMPRSHRQGKKINYFTDFFRVIYWLAKKKNGFRL